MKNSDKNEAKHWFNLERRRRDWGRREWLRMAAGGLAAGSLAGRSSVAASAGAARSSGPLQDLRRLPAPQERFAAPPLERVRIGFVGIGGMGSVHVRNLLRVPGAEIKAVCDIRPEHARRAQQWTVEAGQPEPSAYTRGETDFRRMCEDEELDLVFNATPWRWHVPICLSAMENGKHAATEVPAALTIEDCWKLVESAEKHQKHCVMMENCNYDRRELLIFHLVRRGLLGQILHAECGYLHDLRAIKFSPEGEGLWRRQHSISRDANLYPTHGLGPVAQCLDINRGDQFDYLVSMSGPSMGLQAYARRHFPADAPERNERYQLGDVNVSLIKTVRGRTIYLSHDTNLPRPYSRLNLVQGTRGLAQGYPDRIHIEGRSPGHQWEKAEDYYPEFEHPLWKRLGPQGEGLGHGGMDFIEDYRLIECLRKGLATDMDVYDAATLSAVVELTERSNADRSRPQSFPDFTRGRWKFWSPLPVIGG
ncbi:MAG TPA: Gfo/Idh/MocA family oxidoreductase [Acidobacteriota bacterium]|nr:Gfo/Idh/MocA family oxidoreductase [Acidobacteriota bacterium]